MRRIAITLVVAGAALTPALASAGAAAPSLKSGALYSYRGFSSPLPSAAGAHVTLIAQGPSTIRTNLFSPAPIGSSITIVCDGGNSIVTPGVPKISLRLKKGRYRFAVHKLPGNGVNVSMTGVVESPTSIVGSIKVSSKLCAGSYHYSASLDPSGKPDN